MVAKMQFIVVMSIKVLFPNDQGDVKNILREKNRNIEKQLKKPVKRAGMPVKLKFTKWKSTMKWAI